jgi:hypothetical protein
MKDLYKHTRLESCEKMYSNLGITKLKLFEENKKELNYNLKFQQDIIDNAEKTLNKIQLLEVKQEAVQDNNVLKIDAFFQAYKAKKKRNNLKNLKTIGSMKSIITKTQSSKEDPYGSRVNIFNYKNHFNYTTNDSISYFRDNRLNTDYNVTFKHRFQEDNDDYVTLANLIKKLDITNEIKTERLRVQASRYNPGDYITIRHSPENSPKATINTTCSFKKSLKPIKFEDTETNGFNSYTKYKPKSNKNIDKVNKLNTLFETFCKQEKRAAKIMQTMGNKLVKTRLAEPDGIKQFGNLNPIKIAKLNIKRLYNK